MCNEEEKAHLHIAAVFLEAWKVEMNSYSCVLPHPPELLVQQSLTLQRKEDLLEFKQDFESPHRIPSK